MRQHEEHHIQTGDVRKYTPPSDGKGKKHNKRGKSKKKSSKDKLKMRSCSVLLDRMHSESQEDDLNPNMTGKKIQKLIVRKSGDGITATIMKDADEEVKTVPKIRIKMSSLSPLPEKPAPNEGEASAAVSKNQGKAIVSKSSEQANEKEASAGPASQEDSDKEMATTAQVSEDTNMSVTSTNTEVKVSEESSTAGAIVKVTGKTSETLPKVADAERPVEDQMKTAVATIDKDIASNSKSVKDEKLSEISSKDDVKNFYSKITVMMKESKEGTEHAKIEEMSENKIAKGNLVCVGDTNLGTSKSEFNSNLKSDVKSPDIHIKHAAKLSQTSTVIDLEYNLEGRDLSLEYGHHKCSVCLKKFDILARMMVHKITHAKNKTMRCGFCKKVFRTRGKLFNHALEHTKEKPYGCFHCLERFMELAEIKAHAVESGHVYKPAAQETDAEGTLEKVEETPTRPKRVQRKVVAEKVAENDPSAKKRKKTCDPKGIHDVKNRKLSTDGDLEEKRLKNEKDVANDVDAIVDSTKKLNDEKTKTSQKRSGTVDKVDRKESQEKNDSKEIKKNESSSTVANEISGPLGEDQKDIQKVVKQSNSKDTDAQAKEDLELGQEISQDVKSVGSIGTPIKSQEVGNEVPTQASQMKDNKIIDLKEESITHKSCNQERSKAPVQDGIATKKDNENVVDEEVLSKSQGLASLNLLALDLLSQDLVSQEKTKTPVQADYKKKRVSDEPAKSEEMPVQESTPSSRKLDITENPKLRKKLKSKMCADSKKTDDIKDSKVILEDDTVKNDDVTLKGEQKGETTKTVHTRALRRTQRGRKVNLEEDKKEDEEDTQRRETQSSGKQGDVIKESSKGNEHSDISSVKGEQSVSKPVMRKRPTSLDKEVSKADCEGEKLGCEVERPQKNEKDKTIANDSVTEKKEMLSTVTKKSTITRRTRGCVDGKTQKQLSAKPETTERLVVVDSAEISQQSNEVGKMAAKLCKQNVTKEVGKESSLEAVHVGQPSDSKKESNVQKRKMETESSTKNDGATVAKISKKSDAVIDTPVVLFFKKTKREPDSLFEKEVEMIAGQKRRRRAPSMADDEPPKKEVNVPKGKGRPAQKSSIESCSVIDKDSQKEVVSKVSDVKSIKKVITESANDAKNKKNEQEGARDDKPERRLSTRPTRRLSSKSDELDKNDIQKTHPDDEQVVDQSESNLAKEDEQPAKKKTDRRSSSRRRTELSTDPNDTHTTPAESDKGKELEAKAEHLKSSTKPKDVLKPNTTGKAITGKFKRKTLNDREPDSEHEGSHEKGTSVLGAKNNDMASDTKANAQNETNAENTSATDNKPEAKTTSDADNKAETKTTPDADKKAETKPTADADKKAETKTTAEADKKAETKPTAGADKMEAKFIADTDKSEAKVTTDAANKTGLKATADADKTKANVTAELGNKSKTKATVGADKTEANVTADVGNKSKTKATVGADKTEANVTADVGNKSKTKATVGADKTEANVTADVGNKSKTKATVSADKTEANVTADVGNKSKTVSTVGADKTEAKVTVDAEKEIEMKVTADADMTEAKVIIRADKKTERKETADVGHKAKTNVKVGAAKKTKAKVTVDAEKANADNTETKATADADGTGDPTSNKEVVKQSRRGRPSKASSSIALKNEHQLEESKEANIVKETSKESLVAGNGDKNRRASKDDKEIFTTEAEEKPSKPVAKRLGRGRRSTAKGKEPVSVEDKEDVRQSLRKGRQMRNVYALPKQIKKQKVDKKSEDIVLASDSQEKDDSKADVTSIHSTDSAKTDNAKSGKKSASKFVTCEICGKRMLNRGGNSLRLHMRSHKNVTKDDDKATKETKDKSPTVKPKDVIEKNKATAKAKTVKVDEMKKPLRRSTSNEDKIVTSVDTGTKPVAKRGRPAIVDKDSLEPKKQKLTPVVQESPKITGTDSIETSSAEEWSSDSDDDDSDVDADWNGKILLERIPKTMRHQPIMSDFGCGHKGLPKRDRRQLFQEPICTLSRRILGWRGHLKTRVKLRQGTVEYPFVCQYCCVKYKQSASLVAHLKRFPTHAANSILLRESSEEPSSPVRVRKSKQQQHGKVPRISQSQEESGSEDSDDSSSTSSEEEQEVVNKSSKVLQHNKTESIAAGREKLTCDKCGKEFSFKCNLRRHELSHAKAEKQEESSKIGATRTRKRSGTGDSVDPQPAKPSVDDTTHAKESGVTPKELLDQKGSDDSDTDNVVTIVTKRTQLTAYLPEKNKRIPAYESAPVATKPTAPIACKQMPATIISPGGQVVSTSQVLAQGQGE